MGTIRKILMAILAFFTDTTPDGTRKLSVGRAPLAAMLITMVYKYATQGVGPDNQVLAFMAMAMAYNGFSKTKLAGGNGGEATVTPPVEQSPV